MDDLKVSWLHMLFFLICQHVVLKLQDRMVHTSISNELQAARRCNTILMDNLSTIVFYSYFNPNVCNL